MSDICEPAALHLALGVLEKALKDQEVPVGHHDVGPLRVVVGLPPGAAVMRDAGSEGDGRDAYQPARSVSLLAVLLFLHASGLAAPGSGIKTRWKNCIRQALEQGGKAEDLLPPEALEALEDVMAEQTAAKPATRKTAARRFGVASGTTLKIESIVARGRRHAA